MKILFTGPRDIHATPALERALLATEEFRSSTIIADWNDLDNSVSDNSKEYHFRKSKNLWGLINWQFFLFKIIFSEKPDMIFNMSILSSFPLLIYTIIFRTKSIYDCRDYLAISYDYNVVLKNLIKFFDNIYGNLVNGIVVPDECGYEYFSRVSKSKIVLVYNTVKEYGVKKDFNPGPIRIAYLGYLSLDRNINTIFKFIEESPDVELHIACNYIPENLKKIIPEDANIINHGKLTHKESQELLSQMDYCLIMYNPNIGNYKYIQPTKFYDCLALGLPFICSKGMKNLEKITIDSKNISQEYEKLPFPKLVKTSYFEDNRKLYELKYAFNKIIHDYKSRISSLLLTDIENK